MNPGFVPGFFFSVETMARLQEAGGSGRRAPS